MIKETVRPGYDEYDIAAIEVEVERRLSSGSIILLTITLELRMVLQNI